MKPRIGNIAKTLSRALRLIWLSSPSLAARHTLLTVLQALLPLLALLALKQMIDTATALFHAGAFANLSLAAAPRLYTANPQFASLTQWTLLALLSLALNALARIAAAWISEFHAIAVTDEVYRNLHATLTRADFAFFENPDDQNALYLAREQAISRPMRIIGGVSQLIQSLTGLAGALLILLSFAPILPLLLVLSALPGLALRLRRSRLFFEWQKRVIPLERECSYFHAVMTANEGAKEIRIYGHADYCQERFQRARDALKARRREWRRVVLKYDLAGLAAGFIAAAAALLWLLDRTLSGAITLGALVLCLQAIRRGQAVIASISGATAALLEDAIFLQSYEELSGREQRITAPPQPRPIPSPLQEGIVFENVSFSYQGCATPALKNVSLTLNVNERIVLAGANGAGKSTLIKLLCRLYDPTEGRILVDGTDLRDFDPAQWRLKIGVLFQDFNTYQLSVEENIRIGDPRFKPDAPRIREAADEAGLSAFVSRWPQGLKTLLGRWLHDGIEPSTGQWQKIALARAFLRPAELYLLDEPTSALDGAAQREALESLARLSRNKLTLFTSHRTLPAGLADRVILLENGSVIADAAPAQIADRAEFRELFSAER
jgi:ATP-binding cassette, subfamily B, bacterial